MDVGNKAAFLGVRSSILMEYGLCGNKLALRYAKQAVSADSENAQWHFLLGKAHARIRRMENAFDRPCDEEKTAFDRAIEIDAENRIFMLFSAENYRETANRAYKFHRANGTLFESMKDEIDKLNEKSATLYRYAAAVSIIKKGGRGPFHFLHKFHSICISAARYCGSYL